MRPPNSFHSYCFWWILSFLCDISVIEPSIYVENVSEKTLSWKFAISCSQKLISFAKIKLSEGLEGLDLHFQWLSAQNILELGGAHPHYLSNVPVKIFLLLSVLFTMNESLPQPYLFAIIRNVYIIYLAFETEIYNLSVHFSTSLKKDKFWSPVVL